MMSTLHETKKQRLSVERNDYLSHSATVARCEEALEARQELDATGIITAGLVILKSFSSE